MKSFLIKLYLFVFALLSIIDNSLIAQISNGSPVPKMKLDVTINEEHFILNDGDTLRFNDKLIIVRTSKYMTFDFGVLNFDYPKQFAYEYGEDIGLKNWTLDGNNFVIMYFEFGVKVELDSFIDEMVKKFGKKNCLVTDKQIRLNEIDFTGKRITVNLIGEKLTLDMFPVPTKDKNTHFIAFQDSKNDDGSDSSEGLETIEIINKTIKIK